jgi:beta-glucosidase
MKKTMKQAVSVATALTMAMSMVSAASAETAAEYIAAPYTLEEGIECPTEYLAPVFYENEDGPTIGVTLVGVIKQDGLYFKDSDNDGELDVFEDWRLSSEERAADLVGKMNTEQRIGLLKNALMANPATASADEVYDENGNVILSQLVDLPVEEEEETEDGEETDAYAAYMKSLASAFSYTNIIEAETRSGVIRKDTDTETGALYNNALNMMAEFTAVSKGEVNIPFALISNPMTTGYPGTLGFAAAAMGDESYDVIQEYAELDAAIWDAKGIRQMYGPQIDLVTDPRWSRNETTYTEDPEVMAGIANALVVGYQHGTDGAQDGDVALIMKHFPGDGAAENGFESHYGMGQWRIYGTIGSLETYQLVGFQAAIDAGVAGIMPGYSRPATDARSVTQTYQGVEITPEEIGNAYNTTILQTLLKDTMGFDGFINTDSNIITSQFWGAEDMTEAERYAAVINAGADVVGDGFSTTTDYTAVAEAVNTGLVTEEAFDRATTNRMINFIDMGMFENPYRDAEESKAVGEDNAENIAEMKSEINHKSVVLMKNHDSVLPLTESGKNVYIASYTASGSNDATEESWAAAFEAAGYTIVSSAEEADIAFLDVVPGGVSMSADYMAVLDLVDGLEVEQVDTADQSKTGDTVEVTTLADVKKIAKAADAVHANGGIVIASINISNPWILTNLEPYCDALIGSFSTSVDARMDVLTGAYNPTGKLPVTMVSCNEVIAVNETEIDGNVYQICVSPNDVPGYDKDQYIDAEVLAQSPSGSYAYQDADGNVYAAWFGLSY